MGKDRMSFKKSPSFSDLSSSQHLDLRSLVQPQTPRLSPRHPLMPASLNLFQFSRKEGFLSFAFSLVLVGNNKIMIPHLVLELST